MISVEGRQCKTPCFDNSGACCSGGARTSGWPAPIQQCVHNEGKILTESNLLEVRRTAEGDPLGFEVVVREGKGETRHQVTMSRESCERLTGGKHSSERLIEAAFRFLLDREPKESILGRFDVTVISRYFPEFERELPRYLTTQDR
jgi:hypothetical protein